MSELNHRPTPDVLEQATGALRGAPVPAGPPAELVVATVGAIHNRLARAEPRKDRRRKIMRYIGYGSLATAAAVALGVGLFVFGTTPTEALALDKVFDKVEKAEAVSYTVRETIGEQKERTNTVTVRGDACRFESGTMTWVVDMKAKEALVVQPRTREYQTMDLSGAGISPVPLGVNIREQLLALKKQKAEFEDTEKVGGVPADKYTLAGGVALRQKGNWTLWVGRASGLPVKASFEGNMGGPNIGNIPINRVYETFDWAPKIDQTTFDRTPPKDYTEGVILRTFPMIPAVKKK